MVFSYYYRFSTALGKLRQRNDKLRQVMIKMFKVQSQRFENCRMRKALGQRISSAEKRKRMNARRLQEAQFKEEIQKLISKRLRVVNRCKILICLLGRDSEINQASKDLARVLKTLVIV